jgi:hypothetical protein
MSEKLPRIPDEVLTKLLEDLGEVLTRHEEEYEVGGLLYMGILESLKAAVADYYINNV